MKSKIFRVVVFLFVFSSCNNNQENNYKFPFQNPSLDVDTRVDDLMSRLTLEEKVSQMQDISVAIPRLGIDEYNWWNECLHGVARAGDATSFPQGIGMAATWNTKLINSVADAISTEARAKYNISVAKGQHKRYQGLTMWTPNINIFRDPRWGRGQETYGEDPYLTSRMGVAFVKGLQGDDPDYFKVIATPKHFAVHSGPEYNRHSFDAYTSKKDLWETYLPAFEATVVEAKAFSVMSAYNRYLGSSATASKLLLTDILRDKWGFEGYVVSDCGAIYDIYMFHDLAKNAEDASVLALKAGCDLNCGNSFASLSNAVKNEKISEKDIDISLRRLLVARMKLGIFNSIEDLPFKEVTGDDLESKNTRELALQTAKESIVLLKNEDKTLPLSKDARSIVVVGPNANDKHFLLGNYFGVPTQRTTVLDGVKSIVSKSTKIHYFKGVNITDSKEVFDVISKDVFIDGVNVEYYDNSTLEGNPVYVSKEDAIDFEWGGAAPIDILNPGKFSIRYKGTIKLDYSSSISLAVLEFGGSYKLLIDGEEVVSGTSKTEHEIKPARFNFEKGKEYNIELQYLCTNEWIASIQLLWNLESTIGHKHMLDVVKASDAVIFVGGINARLEGEEMPVPVDGFNKGDRTNMKLPKSQHELLKKLQATGTPVVFVLTSGSAMSINWENDNLSAILSAWYPGQAGGKAVAEVLFGDYNPSGKLPITFYKSINDLPDFEDYSMKGRTYRYFDGEVLYPFGFGLSYTTFNISKPKVEKVVMKDNFNNLVSVEVTNTGEYDGETVIQLYVKYTESNLSDLPQKTLRRFAKVFVKKGEKKIVEFKLNKKDFTLVNNDGESIIESGKIEILVGESSDTNNTCDLIIINK